MTEPLRPDEYFAGPIDYTKKELKASEKKVEGDSKKWARAHGWHVRKWSSPGHTSVPDDIFVKDGRVVFIEYKRVGNEPTGLQCDEAELLLDQDVEVFWTNTVRGTKLILENFRE